jgi:hypothetical protein
VVEVLRVSSDKMLPHGVALDRVREVRDDGELFCLIDPDIKANAPFVQELASLLTDGCAAVTSGKEVWSDDNLVPEGHPGVAGEFFFDRKGFVFGSPHLAVYRRAALEETSARWGVGMGSAGGDLGEEARAKLAEMGHDYVIYDTCKLLNIFLQADGHLLVHRDLPQLVHIGGLSHFLAPTGFVRRSSGEVEPNWAKWPGDPSRYNVAQFTATTLRSLCKGVTPPDIPADTAGPLRQRLELVRREMDDLVATYRRR